MQILLSLLVSGVAVFIASYLLPGVAVDNFISALIVAVLLGIVNAFVKPVVSLLTLPLTVMTLGLFTFVINAVMILLVDALVPGFHVDGFLWALIFSLVVSVINSVLNTFTKK